MRQRLAPIRARFGDSPAELARVALRYALQHAPDAAVLVGFRDAAQIHTNVTRLGDPLREEEITQIRAALNPNALTTKLAELGAKPSPETRQIDAYYNAPHRDFLAAGAISEWLRVRTEERGSSINFKRWHPVDVLIKTRADEYETKVEDVEGHPAAPGGAGLHATGDRGQGPRGVEAARGRGRLRPRRGRGALRGVRVQGRC